MYFREKQLYLISVLVLLWPHTQIPEGERWFGQAQVTEPALGWAFKGFPLRLTKWGVGWLPEGDLKQCYQKKGNKGVWQIKTTYVCCNFYMLLCIIHTGWMLRDYVGSLLKSELTWRDKNQGLRICFKVLQVILMGRWAWKETSGHVQWLGIWIPGLPLTSWIILG